MRAGNIYYRLFYLKLIKYSIKEKATWVIQIAFLYCFRGYCNK